MTDYYCGVKDKKDWPKGKTRRGTMIECIKGGKVSYYGLKKIDPITFKTHAGKGKVSNKLPDSREELIKLFASLKGSVNRFKGRYETTKDKEKKDGYFKEWKKAEKEFNKVSNKLKKIIAKEDKGKTKAKTKAKVKATAKAKAKAKPKVKPVKRVAKKKPAKRKTKVKTAKKKAKPKTKIKAPKRLGKKKPKIKTKIKTKPKTKVKAPKRLGKKKPKIKTKVGKTCKVRKTKVKGHKVVTSISCGNAKRDKDGNIIESNEVIVF